MWSQLLAAIPALVLGGITTYIAIQQFAVNRRHYRLALFDKRMVVYEVTMAHIAMVMQKMAAPLDKNVEFLSATRDAEFLFGKEVGDFIDTVWKQGNRLEAHKNVGTNHKAMADIANWFSEQISEGRKLFFPYLDFTDKF